MEVIEADLARVPIESIRVPTAEFGAVRAAAERQVTAETARGVTDWFAGVEHRPGWCEGIRTTLR